MRAFSVLWRHANIVQFWVGYVRLMAFLSVLFHIVLFERELRKDYPEIPYIQDLLKRSE